MVIETERLYIRHFLKEDSLSCFHGWGTDEKLGDYILGYPMDRNQMESFVFTMVQNQNAWVITEKDSNECIGYVSFDVPYQELRIGEIGYVIGEKWQGKGYAYEAIKRMITEYLSKDKLYLIEAKCNIDNKHSINLLEKIGFIKDGVFRKRRIDKKTGEYRDLVVYSITLDEWKKIFPIL